MKARVSQLHRTEKAWLELANWIPDAGEIIVYDPDENFSYARLKIGDGKSTLQELEFFIEAAIARALEPEAVAARANKTIITDSGRITAYKK